MRQPGKPAEVGRTAPERPALEHGPIATRCGAAQGLRTRENTNRFGVSFRAHIAGGTSKLELAPA